MREKEETLLWFIALELSNRHFSTGRKDVKLWQFGIRNAECGMRNYAKRLKISIPYSLFPIPYSLLPTAYCLLPTAYCLFPHFSRKFVEQFIDKAERICYNNI